jgi:hypothetical protein
MWPTLVGFTLSIMHKSSAPAVHVKKRSIYMFSLHIYMLLNVIVSEDMPL